jgi:hypothetical protein
MSQSESSTQFAPLEPTTNVPAVSGGTVVGSRNSSRALWGVCILGLALLFVGGIYIGQEFLVERPENAGLRIDPKYLDFGEVWADKEFKWRIPIQNISNRPVGIAEFTASCQCSQIEPKSLTIEPGETAEVVATIDLTVGRDTDPSEPRRTFEIAIHPIVSVASSRPPGFVLKGTAKDVFTCTPRAVDLGEVLSGTAGEPKTVRLMSDVALSSVVALRQPDMRIEIELVDPESPRLGRGVNSTGYLLTVTPTDQIPIGKIDRTIYLQATDVQGKKLPEFPVTVTGKIVFDVAVEPREIYAGLIEMGTTYETILTLRSRAGSPFALFAVEQELGVTLKPLIETSASEPIHNSTDAVKVPLESFKSSENGSALRFRLALTPQHEGDQRTNATIQASSVANNQHMEITVPIVYYGTRKLLNSPKDKQ